ncbi:MAG: CRISPR-associated helicase Cas3' [Chloroflexi bacterium]|nr:CRISPR-associated helicase Cas3' [Chloroflexota bacterium]
MVMDAALKGRYRGFFRRQVGREPYSYQLQVADRILAGRNLILRAPTGAGKTWAVLAPFLFSRQEVLDGPSRLIYALPLRTLAQGVYRQAREAAEKLGWPTEAITAETDGHTLETISPSVTLQTGEQPDDPFFDRGRIIVTTYDQVLSGLLDGPYGLSGRLHNINAAAVAGALVVFDEFHLMEPHKAFLTAVAGLRLFHGLCQSVWMTATATGPLEDQLRDALNAERIPSTQEEWDGMLAKLPSVSQVTRGLVVEQDPLTPEAVLRHHSGRSIVLLNTVGRAQEMYKALREEIDAREMGIPVMLLHSRFFKEDREEKESLLSALFGKDGKGPAILVATQVVEAGLDLTCEHLHTELCPLNSLAQRAGRCARFPNDSGTVHIYPLPDEDRSWLPYGSPSGEDSVLTKTRQLLATVNSQRLDPTVVAEWVEKVHREDDANRLVEGWHNRLTECLRRIELGAIQRQSVRVADLIRGDDEDSMRVIVSREEDLPEKPGLRQGLSLRRGQLTALLRGSQDEFGSYWDATGEQPLWLPLRSQDDLNRTYVVCLRPEVTAYDSDVGLRLGEAGKMESPDREETPRPGYRPLQRESWTDHARRVANEAKARLDREGTLLFDGLQNLYDLSPEAVREAAQACALLHDLGKLQDRWQRWAEAAQRSRDPAYQHAEPLAHTDYDPESSEDWERLRHLRAQGCVRPHHAPASAYYSGAFLAALLPSVPEDRRTHVASACAAAILGHHGGWLPQELNLGISGLHPEWEAAVKTAVPAIAAATVVRALQNRQDKRGTAQQLLDWTTGADSLQEWWPLVAYFSRTLRLADQRATAEGGCFE